MLIVINKRKAQASIEYMFVITLILMVFLVFQKYITRSFSGRWKATGDSLGHGRQYDPNLSVECAYDFVYTNSWYSPSCYDAANCDRSCKSEVHHDVGLCSACIGSCRAGQCN